eukprot:3401181-Lingulodinium_polyedra.AAC.1
MRCASRFPENDDGSCVQYGKPLRSATCIAIWPRVVYDWNRSFLSTGPTTQPKGHQGVWSGTW